MAFNNLGPLVYLGPGQSAYWYFDRGGGDAGYQAAGADVKTPSAGPPHVASNQWKAKFNSGYTRWGVTITNAGTSGAWHQLQGGGAT
jgi:hypothetical protein